MDLSLELLYPQRISNRNEPMKVIVYYDYICPFCFIATKRIDTLAKEFDIDVEWKGIEIHPEIPPQGIKRRNTLRLEQTIQNLAEMGEEDRVQIKLPGFVTNSRLSLEASEFAKTENKFIEFHIGVYKSYFQYGDNIGSKDIILNIAEKSGLQVRKLEECLNQRTMSKTIETNSREAEKNLILGVPTFLFGRFPVHGVQSLGSLRKIISRAIERS
jgi:predicted DsbA family dithiol-disulfide isomerase